MAIDRLATMHIGVGRRDAVWLGAVVSSGTSYRYEAWWGKRTGNLQTLRSPRPWYSDAYEPRRELMRMMLEKTEEGYQHIDWRQLTYYLRSTVRRLADSSIVPATDQVSRIDPATMLPPTSEPAATLAPHTFISSTLRAPDGAFRCGMRGCTMTRVSIIHTRHLTQHQYVRGAGGWCVDCHQSQSLTLHRQQTLQERSAEWRQRTRRERGPGDPSPHIFVGSEYIDLNGAVMCARCAELEVEMWHSEDARRTQWQQARGASWRGIGSPLHIFRGSSLYRAAVTGILLCEECGMIERTTGVDAHIFNVAPKPVEPEHPVALVPLEYQPVIRRRRNIEPGF